jgi:hypothetical protein
MKTRHGDRSTRRAALVNYYQELGRQAGHRDRPVPEIPPAAELDFVDGWVIRNRRPVWCTVNRALVGSHGRARRNEWPLARSAWLTTLEQRLALLEEVDQRTPMPEARDPEWLNAAIDFYASLASQAQRAMRGAAPIPDVPAHSEMDFIDGWLMWKGKPVWWSGERTMGAATAISASPAKASAGPAAPARERPRLRRLLALPWRRAAA